MYGSRKAHSRPVFCAPLWILWSASRSSWECSSYHCPCLSIPFLFSSSPFSSSFSVFPLYYSFYEDHRWVKMKPEALLHFAKYKHQDQARTKVDPHLILRYRWWNQGPICHSLASNSTFFTWNSSQFPEQFPKLWVDPPQSHNSDPHRCHSPTEAVDLPFRVEIK